MPICINCTYPVPHLYTTYSKADDKSLGKGVRLTQCPNCKGFADKYVEHDSVVLFLDLVLIRPQVGGDGRQRQGVPRSCASAAPCSERPFSKAVDVLVAAR